MLVSECVFVPFGVGVAHLKPVFVVSGALEIHHRAQARALRDDLLIRLIETS